MRLKLPSLLTSLPLGLGDGFGFGAIFGGGVLLVGVVLVGVAGLLGVLVFLLVGVTSAVGLKCPPKIMFNLQINNVIARWFMV